MALVCIHCADAQRRLRIMLLVGYGHDVEELIDQLGLDHVALAGQSGGGPHALAAAHVLQGRVSTVSLISSAGPVYEPSAREGMNGFMTTTTWFAQHAPRLMPIPISLLSLMMSTPQRSARMIKQHVKRLSEVDRANADRPETQHILEGIYDAFSSGTRGVCDEFRAIGQPWGFTLEEITVPVEMWHGTDDNSCPIAMARGMAARLPNAKLHELPGLGHTFYDDELDEAMTELRRSNERI